MIPAHTAYHGPLALVLFAQKLQSSGVDSVLDAAYKTN